MQALLPSPLLAASSATEAGAALARSLRFQSTSLGPLEVIPLLPGRENQHQFRERHTPLQLEHRECSPGVSGHVYRAVLP